MIQIGVDTLALVILVGFFVVVNVRDVQVAILHHFMFPPDLDDNFGDFETGLKFTRSRVTPA